nr:rRNA maturation RNase YbeY [Veillonella denticariosi]
MYSLSPLMKGMTMKAVKRSIICWGDMIICLERAREQAIEYGHSFERELAYLTTHSCLHILGYDHMNDEDKKEMRTEEEFVLGNLGYVREDAPYNE